jgi:uncharacterized protein with PIN domain
MKAFILDPTLGRLARDLRMLGFDTLWKEDHSHLQLRKISQEERRILITGDRALADAQSADICHYLQAQERDTQLLEVLNRFGLADSARNGKGFLTRCLHCNSAILPAKPHQILHLVSGDIATRFDHFYFCPRCEHVYWKNEHWERLQRWVQKLLA